MLEGALPRCCRTDRDVPDGQAGRRCQAAQRAKPLGGGPRQLAHPRAACVRAPPTPHPTHPPVWRSEEAERKRTYKTKAETEAKKPVTSTIVLTLLFISGEHCGGRGAGRRGPAHCARCARMATSWFAAAHPSSARSWVCSWLRTANVLPPPPRRAPCSGGAHAAVLGIHQRGQVTRLLALPLAGLPASATRPLPCVPLPPLRRDIHHCCCFDILCSRCV